MSPPASTARLVARYHTQVPSEAERNAAKSWEIQRLRSTSSPADSGTTASASANPGYGRCPSDDRGGCLRWHITGQVIRSFERR